MAMIKKEPDFRGEQTYVFIPVLSLCAVTLGQSKPRSLLYPSVPSTVTGRLTCLSAPVLMDMKVLWKVM